MFKLFTFLFHTFPLILAWLYLLVAIFCVVVHIKQIKSKAKVSIGQWAFSVLNAGYILFFFGNTDYLPRFLGADFCGSRITRNFYLVHLVEI